MALPCSIRWIAVPAKPGRRGEKAGANASPRRLVCRAWSDVRVDQTRVDLLAWLSAGLSCGLGIARRGRLRGV